MAIGRPSSRVQSMSHLPWVMNRPRTWNWSWLRTCKLKFMVDLASHLADQNGWLPESDVFTNPSEDSLGSFLSSPFTAARTWSGPGYTGVTSSNSCRSIQLGWHATSLLRYTITVKISLLMQLRNWHFKPQWGTHLPRTIWQGLHHQRHCQAVWADVWARKSTQAWRFDAYAHHYAWAKKPAHKNHEST